MKVFISWSKQVSQQVAEALRDWLSLVIQDVEPWMSKADLEAGVRWGQELGARLQEIDFGIVCVTAQNRLEPRIHFEAGALSKQVATARVVPLLYRMEFAALPAPLQQFQAKLADEDGVREIVGSIYSVLPKPVLSVDALERTFDKWWPDLRSKWGSIVIPEGAPESPPFDEKAALQEMQLAIRELSRNGFRRSGPPPVIDGISGDLSFRITSGSGQTSEFGGVAAELARFASDYMQSKGIPWKEALLRKGEIIEAAVVDAGLMSKFMTLSKLQDAMVNVLKRFERAGIVESKEFMTAWEGLANFADRQ